MKKILLSALIIMAVLSGCGINQEVKNSVNNENRIVATSVTLCEIFDKLNIDLVGVPDTSFQIPERYKDAEKIGLPMSVDIEKVKSLNPTEIFSPSSLKNDLEPKYEAAGLKSTFADLSGVEPMMEFIEYLGQKYDRQKEAKKITEIYDKLVDEYLQKRKDKEKPKVLILTGVPGAYMVASDKSYIGDLVKIAGGDNVFKSENKDFMNINTEELSKSDPDIILRTAHGMPEEVIEFFGKEFEQNDIWKHFRAVQSGKVFDLDYNIFGISAGLSYEKGIEILYDIFYEE